MWSCALSSTWLAIANPSLAVSSLRPRLAVEISTAAASRPCMSSTWSAGSNSPIRVMSPPPCTDGCGAMPSTIPPNSAGPADVVHGIMVGMRDTAWR